MLRFVSILFLIIALILLAPDLYKASIGLPLTGWSVWSVALNSVWATLNLKDLLNGEGR